MPANFNNQGLNYQERRGGYGPGVGYGGGRGGGMHKSQSFAGVGMQQQVKHHFLCASLIYRAVMGMALLVDIRIAIVAGDMILVVGVVVVVDNNGKSDIV